LNSEQNDDDRQSGGQSGNSAGRAHLDNGWDKQERSEAALVDCLADVANRDLILPIPVPTSCSMTVSSPSSGSCGAIAQNPLLGACTKTGSDPFSSSQEA
jgi:hypothetical protein